MLQVASLEQALDVRDFLREGRVLGADLYPYVSRFQYEGIVRLTYWD